MTVFQPFADDSGSDPQSHTFVLGGLIATPAEWTPFAAAWQTALDNGPPAKLDYFKMAEAMSLSGQFSRRCGWTEGLRDSKVAELVEIIVKHVLYGAWVSLRQEDYRKFLQSIPLPMRNLSTDVPHMLLITQFVLMLCEHAKRHRAHCSFEFFFDQQQGIEQEMLFTWPMVKSLAAEGGVEEYLGPVPCFGDEKQFLPLQAADLFAWEHRRHQTKNRLLIVPPSALLRRLGEVPTVHVTFTEEALLSMNETLLPMSAQFAKENPATPMLTAGKKSRNLSKHSKRGRKAISSRQISS